MSDRVFIPVDDQLFEAIESRSRWNDAIVVGDQVFVTGQLGWDKATGQLVEGIEAQTQLALENLRDVLRRAGSDLQDVVQMRVYITEHDDYHRYEPIYDRFFPESPPVRVTVVVKELIHHALIDFEALAIKRR
jgi:2-iminobutanoate/2-iminopropanoate deaminase